MFEHTLHSLGPALPARLSHKFTPEDSPDAEAGDEGCSDLLSTNQNRSTAKDGRRDVRRSFSLPHTGCRLSLSAAAVSRCAQVVLGIETFSALQSKVRGVVARAFKEHLPPTSGLPSREFRISVHSKELWAMSHHHPRSSYKQDSAGCEHFLQNCSVHWVRGAGGSGHLQVSAGWYVLACCVTAV